MAHLLRRVIATACVVGGGAVLAGCGGSPASAPTTTLSSTALVKAQTTFSDTVVTYNNAFAHFGAEIKADLKVGLQPTSAKVLVQAKAFGDSLPTIWAPLVSTKFPAKVQPAVANVVAAFKVLQVDYRVVAKGKGTTTPNFQAKLTRDEKAVYSAEQTAAHLLGVIIATP